MVEEADERLDSNWQLRKSRGSMLLGHTCYSHQLLLWRHIVTLIPCAFKQELCVCVRTTVIHRIPMSPVHPMSGSLTAPQVMPGLNPKPFIEP